MNSTITNGFGSADLSSTLTELLETDVWPQLQRSHFMWNRFFQKRPKDVNSRKRKFPIYLRPSQVGSFRSEGQALPFAGKEVEAQAEFGYTKYQRGWSFSAEAMEEMKGSSSILKMGERLERYRTNLKVELARLFYGDGTSKLAEVSGVGSAASGILACSTASGNMGTTNLEIGSYYQILDASNSYAVLTYGGYRYFKLVVASTTGANAAFNNPAGAAPDFTVGTAVAAADIIVPVGSYNLAMHGLDYHVVDASQTEWQGLTLSSYPELRSIVKDASSADLTLGMANFLEDVVIFRRDDTDKGGEQDSLIITSPGQRTRLKMILNSLRRADMGQKTLTTGGVDVESQFGNKWEVDVHCPDDRIYHLKESDFSMLVLQNLTYVDNGAGGNMVLRRDDADADFDNYSHIYDGWFTMMFEFISREPRNQAAITGLGTSGIPRKHSWFR